MQYIEDLKVFCHVAGTGIEMAFTKKKKYSLQCEWSNCVQVIEDMEEFYKHLEDHFWTDFATVPLERECIPFIIIFYSEAVNIFGPKSTFYELH